MDGEGEGCMWIGCSSPRRMLARWFSLFRKAKGKTLLGQSGKREDDVAAVRCSLNGLIEGDQSGCAPESSPSGLSKKDLFFNLGVGCTLLHLIAIGKDELQKMVELRSEMLKFLENAKEELRSKEELLSKPHEPCEIYAYSTTDVAEGPESSNYLLSPQALSTSFSLPESSMSVVHDRSSKHDASKQEQCFGEMDQLEAELEAELELLQIHLDPQKKHSKHQKQRRHKVAAKDTVLVESHGLSSGEMIDPKEESSIEQFEVCPYELERRLHELLEARQQEQIRELEASLECAKHKLHEKETEISWWKDTASLFSQRIPESSRLNLKQFPETHPLSR